MYKFRKHGGQEPPRKICKLCDFTCLTTGGLMFQKMLNLQDFRVLKSLSVLYAFSENRIKEHDFPFTIMVQKHFCSVKCASFYVLKKALLLGICTENMMVWPPRQIMCANYVIIPSQ